MKAYLLTLIGVALALSLVSILSPTGERGGIAKHVGLLVSLVLICTLLAPIRGLIENLPALLDPDWIHQEENSSAHDGYREEMEQALNNASTAYFSDMLTQALCAEFSIPD